MARKFEGKAATAATGLLSLWFLGAAALGPAAWGQGGQQDKAAVPATGSAALPLPAPFSRDCQAANSGDLSASPLPNVAAALRQRKNLKILAIGASAGRIGRQGSYTAQIEQILEQAIKGLDVVIINRGVSGELASDAERRIKTEVALNKPDLVLWQVGTNDALAYIAIDELRTTLVDTIQWLKEHNVDVVLAGLQFVKRMEQDDQYRAVRDLIRSVATKEKVLVVRRPEAIRLLNNAAISGGGLFPEEFAQTEAGYACLAEYVSRAITVGAFGRGLRERPTQANQPPPNRPTPAPSPAPSPR